MPTRRTNLDELLFFRQSVAMPADPIADDVGARIRAEMGRQRMSMVKLAGKTRIPRTTLYHQINAGTVTTPTLVRVAKALGVEPSELLPEPSEAAS